MVDLFSGKMNLNVKNIGIMEITEDEVCAFLKENYDGRLTQLAIRCIVAHFIITQQVKRGFKDKIHAYETIRDCAYRHL